MHFSPASLVGLPRCPLLVQFHLFAVCMLSGSALGQFVACAWDRLLIPCLPGRHCRAIIDDRAWWFAPLSASSQQESVASHHCYLHARSHITHHLAVRPFPLLRQQSSQSLFRFSCLRSCHPIHRVHQRSEVSAPEPTRFHVLFLLLFLVSLQCFDWAHVSG